MRCSQSTLGQEPSKTRAVWGKYQLFQESEINVQACSHRPDLLMCHRFYLFSGVEITVDG